MQRTELWMGQNLLTFKVQYGYPAVHGKFNLFPESTHNERRPKVAAEPFASRCVFLSYNVHSALVLLAFNSTAAWRKGWQVLWVTVQSYNRNITTGDRSFLCPGERVLFDVNISNIWSILRCHMLPPFSDWTRFMVRADRNDQPTA